MNKAINKTLLLTTCVISGAFSLIISPAHAQTVQQIQPNYYQQPPMAAVVTTQPVVVQPAVVQPVAVQPSFVSTSPVQSFFSPIADRIISDPMYLPLQGQVYGTTAYTYTDGFHDSYNHLGANTSKNNNYGNTFTQSFAYGITDDVDVVLSDSYAFGDTDSDSLRTGATTTSNSTGLTDPTLSLTYRYVDQRHNAPFSADLFASYSPDMLISRNAGGGHTGTEDSGRQTATFRTDIGREMQGLTLEGLAGATFYGQRDFVALSNNNNETDSPYWAYFLAADSQVRLTERFSINGNVRWNIQENEHGANNNSGLVWKLDNPNNIDFTAAMNYHLIPNRLVAQASYDNIMYSHTATEYSVPADNSEVKKQSSNVFGARMLYTFN